MNAPVGGFPDSLLAEAQEQAQQQQRRPLEVLEDLLALEPDAMVAALSAQLNYRQATMRDMREWQVAFDVISYNQAQQKECLAFYDHTQSLVLVFAVPFNRQLPLWVQHAIQQPFA